MAKTLVGCPYHAQDTDYFCGAAAAMMILERLKGIKTIQDKLYQWNHTNNKLGSWYTDPVGLKTTLQSKSGRTFGVHKPTSEPEGSRWIVDSLLTRGLPPAALVLGSMHWIVIADVETEVDPSSGAHRLQFLWIRNPFPLPSAPIVHEPNDDCQLMPHADEMIDYATWVRDYFTGAFFDDPQNRLQFISVSDDVAQPTIPALLKPKLLAPKPPVTGLLESAAIIGTRLAELRTEDARTISAFQRPEWGQPLRVRRLDRPGQFYHLLPFEGDDGVAGILRLRGANHSFQGLRFLAGQDLYDPITSDRARASVVETAGDILKARKHWTSFEGKARESVDLVWQPCRESLSPDLPFREFRMGNDHYYVRLDGKVFPQLTTHEAGL